VDWNKIKAEYIAGGTSYRKLCAKYGVSRTTLQRKAKDEKWLDLRSQAEAKAESKIVEGISKRSAKIDEKFYSLVDKLMQKAEETIENTPVWSVNALKEMSTALKYLKECKGVKSDIDLREQEARIKNLEKQAAEEDNTLTEIKVTFGSDDGDSGQWAE
jgi:transposase-like protein